MEGSGKEKGRGRGIKGKGRGKWARTPPLQIYDYATQQEQQRVAVGPGNAR